MNSRNDIIEGLVREHSVKLATYARHLGADEAFAKDAANEAFLRLCSMPEIRPESAKAWLYKVCRNYVFDEFRRRKRTVPCDGGGLGEIRDDAPCAYSACDENERAKIILNEVRKLPEAQSEAVFMRYYNGLEYSQIAHVMDMSVSNVGVTLNRAIARLRKNLEGII